MTNPMSAQDLIALLGGDGDLLDHLIGEGIVEETEQGFAADEVERVLVAHTLVRELEVNWAGVDIILQLRDDLLTTRRWLAALLSRAAAPATRLSPDSASDSTPGSSAGSTPGSSADDE